MPPMRTESEPEPEPTDQSGRGEFSRPETTCDNPCCRGIGFPAPSTSTDESPGTCLVCFESLENAVVGLLSNCRHAFCDACIRAWKGDKWGYKCPYCLVHSNDVVHASARLLGGGEEIKRKIFDAHADCFRNDPDLGRLLDGLNDQWRSLTTTLLRWRGDSLLHPMLLSDYAADTKRVLTGWNTRYATYRQRNRRRVSTAHLYLSLPGVSFQVMLTTDRCDHRGRPEPDNAFADRAASCLAEQLASSSEALPNFLNPHFGQFVVWRDFERSTCALLVNKNESTMPPVSHLPPPLPSFLPPLLSLISSSLLPPPLLLLSPREAETDRRRDFLLSLLPHNFPGEVIQSEEDDDYEEGLVNLIACTCFPTVDLLQFIDIKEIDLRKIGVDLTPWM